VAPPTAIRFQLVVSTVGSSPIAQPLVFTHTYAEPVLVAALLFASAVTTSLKV
jgi:hypothetical protein